MFTDPQDPNYTEPANEPNAEAEPENPREENAQPGGRSPANPAEPDDYVSEIRQSLANEETNIRRRTGNLIRRITGSLRRVTGSLLEPDKPKPEGEGAVSVPPVADTSEKVPTGRLSEEPELSDELLTGRLGEEPTQPISGELSTGRTRSSAAPEAGESNLPASGPGSEPAHGTPDHFITGRLGVAPEEAEISDDLLTGRLGREPKQPAGDMVTRRLDEAPEPETPDNLLTGRLGVAPEEEIPDHMLTGRLGQEPEEEPSDELLTGRLGREPKQPPPGNMVTRRLDETPEPETPDNLLTGRLGVAPEEEIPDHMLTGRLGQEPEPEMPDSLLTGRLDEAPEEAEISDDLLTGRLGREPKQPPPGNMVTRRLDEAPEPEMPDSFLTGRLGVAPEPEIPDNVLAGRLDQTLEAEIPDALITHEPEEAPEQEIPDELLTGRLGLASEPASEALPEMPGRPGSMPPDTSQPFPLPETWSDLPDAGSEAAELLEMEEKSPPELKHGPEAVLGDEDAITLLESGAIAAPEMAEEAGALHDKDWMREIREEAEQEEIETGKAGAETWPEQPISEQPAPQSPSPLRNFLAGIFGKPGERGKHQEESEISDELFNGRLERSLGAEEGPSPTTAMGDALIPPPTPVMESASGEARLGELLPAAFDMGEPPVTGDTSLPTAPVSQKEEDFFEGLEVNFGSVSETGEETSEYEIYPEDEALLWGDTAQRAAEPAAPDIPISPEDIWESETDRSGYGSDLRREFWSEAAEPETPTQDLFPVEAPIVPASEDIYAATYLTGEDYLPAMIEEPEEKADQGELLGTILSSKPETEGGSSMEDLRTIALKDYEEGDLDDSDYTYKIDWGDEGISDRTEWEGAQAEQIKIQEEQAEAETRQALSTDWKSWFANRKTSHKILLVEAAIVIIALVAAVPYFLYMIFRGPSATTVETPALVVASDMPYPTGVTLPGGWYFPLERSTMINGEWQPRTSEWLQGSELRRVVALPWNAQTEAVIKTFQIGDGVELYLSNNETLNYRVYSIEQVAKTDPGVYSDRTPSLAIILYQGKDPTRWVIICKP